LARETKGESRSKGEGMTEEKQSLQCRILAKTFERAFDDLKRLSETEQQSLLAAIGRSVLQTIPQSPTDAAKPVESVSTSNFRADFPLRQVRQQTFRNEAVQVDGIEFIDCTFDAVTFKFEGQAPFNFTTVHIENGSKLTVASDNPAIYAAIELTIAIMKLVNASPSPPASA
jgi:hypothetical protein